jgi:hypothetical protein
MINFFSGKLALFSKVDFWSVEDFSTFDVNGIQDFISAILFLSVAALSSKQLMQIALLSLSSLISTLLE